MYCKKCGNEIKENETFCTNCGTSVDDNIAQHTEPVKIKLSTFIILIVIMLVLFSGICIFIISKKNGKNIKTADVDNTILEQKNTNTEPNTENTEINQASTNAYLGNVSFGNMNADDDNYTKIKQEIIDYFDNDYINFSVRYAQRYPQVFQDAKVMTIVTVEKVLKSTNEEYEVLAKENTITGNNSQIEPNKTEDEQLLLISGGQLNKRLLANDFIYVYGRYKGVESREIDGKTYMVSKIQAYSVLEVKYSKIEGVLKSKCNYQTIKDVAEFIFGKDIKILAADEYVDEGFYKIVLDNQSNANFKAFIMSENDGDITYASEENDLTENVVKKLFVSADFKHFIVSTCDKNTKHVYIDYFNSDFKKIWSREFDYTSTKSFISPMDYTENKMAVVVDNDLYLLNLETGENIIEPILVGEKIKVNMMSDGVILIGDNNKDTIMKVDYTGKVLYKINAETEMEQITQATTQIVNGKVVIKLEGRYPYNNNKGMFQPTKYIVINNDGGVEISTEDLDGGYFLL